MRARFVRRRRGAAQVEYALLIALLALALVVALASSGQWLAALTGRNANAIPAADIAPATPHWTTAADLGSEAIRTPFQRKLAASGPRPILRYRLAPADASGLLLASDGTLSGVLAAQGAQTVEAIAEDTDGATLAGTFMLFGRPIVLDAHGPAAGNYRSGDILEFSLHFSTAVTASADVRLTVGLASGARALAVSGGNGSDTLHFALALTPADRDGDGLEMLELQDGVLTSAFGPPDRDFAAPALAAVRAVGDAAMAVAVGDSGAAFTVDGSGWTPAPSAGTAPLAAVAWGNGRFVAVGGGRVTISEDGVSWHAGGPLPGAAAGRDIAFADGRFAATDGGNRLWLSANGLAWQASPQAPGSLDWAVGARGGFLAAGSAAVGVAYLSDSWEPALAPDGTATVALVAGGGYALRRGSDDALRIAGDGSGWRAATLPAGATRLALAPDGSALATGDGMWAAQAPALDWQQAAATERPIALAPLPGGAWAAGTADGTLARQDVAGWHPGFRAAGAIRDIASRLPALAEAPGSEALRAVDDSHDLPASGALALTAAELLVNDCGTGPLRIVAVKAAQSGDAVLAEDGTGIAFTPTDGEAPGFRYRIRDAQGSEAMAWVALRRAVATGLLVAGGAGGVLAESSDGTAWTPSSATARGAIRALVAEGGDGWAAVGDRGVLHRAEGSDWQLAFGATDLRDIAFGNGRLVAVAATAPGLRSAGAGSADWATAGTGVPAARTFTAIAFAAGRFVALGQDTAAIGETGDSWTALSHGLGAAPRSLQHDGRRFLAILEGGAMAASVDGLHWSPAADAPPAAIVAGWFGQQQSLALAGDGTAWRRSGSGSWSPAGTVPGASAVAATAAGWFVATADGRVFASADLSSWSPQQAAPAGASLSAIAAAQPRSRGNAAGGPAPTALDDSLSLQRLIDTQIAAADLLGNDSGAGLSLLDVRAIGGLAEIHVLPDGSAIALTPAEGNGGTAAFDYTVVDASGATATARATLAIVDPDIVAVAAGNRGALTVGTAAGDWLAPGQPFGATADIRALTWDGTRWLAAEATGKLWQSPDALSWSVLGTPGISGVTLLRYDATAGRYWLGGTGKLLYASDPSGSWTAASIALGSNDALDIGFAGGTAYVLAGSAASGAGATATYWSTGPTTWKSVAAPGNFRFYSLLRDAQDRMRGLGYDTALKSQTAGSGSWANAAAMTGCGTSSTRPLAASSGSIAVASGSAGCVWTLSPGGSWSGERVPGVSDSLVGIAQHAGMPLAVSATHVYLKAGSAWSAPPLALPTGASLKAIAAR